MRLLTFSERRNDYSKVHRNNLINNILTQIEASAAGADDAIMLERDGFLARTSANLALYIPVCGISSAHVAMSINAVGCLSFRRGVPYSIAAVSGTGRESTIRGIL